MGVGRDGSGAGCGWGGVDAGRDCACTCPCTSRARAQTHASVCESPPCKFKRARLILIHARRAHVRIQRLRLSCRQPRALAVAPSPTGITRDPHASGAAGPLVGPRGIAPNSAEAIPPEVVLPLRLRRPISLLISLSLRLRRLAVWRRRCGSLPAVAFSRMVRLADAALAPNLASGRG